MFSAVSYTFRTFAIGVTAGLKSPPDFKSTGIEGLINKRPQQILWPLEILAS